MGLWNRQREKEVLIECTFASPKSKDFCNPSHPFRINLSSPDSQKTLEAHVQQHIERDSSMFGLSIKRFGCSICTYETKPFPSNSATTLKALGREEMQAMIDLEDHISGNAER